MPKIITNLIIFVVGVVSGAAVMAYFKQKDCEEQIASVKEAFASKSNSKVEVKSTKAENASDEKIDTDKTPSTSVSGFQYRNEPTTVKSYSNITTNYNKVEPMDEIEWGTRVIAPTEVGMCPDYDIETLQYYSDGVLTDDDGRVIESPDDILCDNALTSFGEYEPDCVYVVNDDDSMYYEIYKNDERYADIRPDSDLENIYDARREV